LKQGLTLLELVIVLFILAALTGVAVRSLGPVADRARYERTQQLMTEIEHAYQLRSIEAGGVVYYSGFIADMGGLPIARPGDDPSTQAQPQPLELWLQGDLPPFAITPFDDPDTLRVEKIPVAAGWKGPYLLLPPGSTGLLDGFGNALVPLNPNSNQADVGEEIAGFVSLGANGVMPSGEVNVDRFSGTVHFRLIDSMGNNPVLATGETLRVRLYGPRDGAPARIDEQNLASGVFSGSVSGTCGPRVLKAFVTTGSAPNESVVRESKSYQIMIRSAGNPLRDLVIP
jgi:prepilin-type N-terminal cleavage/methylation domain-containing protein